MPPPKPKVPPYLLMLVVSFALLGLIGYQTLKDRKVSGDLLKKKDALIQEKISAAHKLEQLLQKEKKKTTELQAKLVKLSSQKDALDGLKDGLSGQLMELGRVKKLTEEGKKQLESSLQEKENEVKDLKEKLASVDEQEEKLKDLKKEIAQKDAEINGLKARIEALGEANEKLGRESTTAMGRRDDEVEAKHEKKVEKNDLNSGEALVEKTPEVEEDTEDPKGKETAHKHSEEQEDKHSEEQVDQHREEEADLHHEEQADQHHEEEADLHHEEQADQHHEEQADLHHEEQADQHSEEQVDTSHKRSSAQNMDMVDEESRVDDREDPSLNDDSSEEAEAEAEKIHEEEETDDQEQPDVDIESVTKTDPDENEIAAME